MIHILDRKRLNLLYSFAYLFPQILAVFSFLSFLAFFNLNWLFCLLFLVFLAPIPAPWRAWGEIRGYSMSMYFKGTHYEKNNIKWEYEEYAKWATSLFCNSSYYFMFPFRKYVYNKLLTNYKLILGGLDKNLFELYYDVYKFIEGVTYETKRE
jgi:hypothetical protein